MVRFSLRTRFSAMKKDQPPDAHLSPFEEKAAMVALAGWRLEGDKTDR